MHTRIPFHHVLREWTISTDEREARTGGTGYPNFSRPGTVQSRDCLEPQRINHLYNERHPFAYGILTSWFISQPDLRHHIVSHPAVKGYYSSPVQIQSSGLRQVHRLPQDCPVQCRSRGGGLVSEPKHWSHGSLAVGLILCPTAASCHELLYFALTRPPKNVNAEPFWKAYTCRQRLLFFAC